MSEEGMSISSVKWMKYAHLAECGETQTQLCEHTGPSQTLDERWCPGHSRLTPEGGLGLPAPLWLDSFAEGMHGLALSL